MTDIRILSLPDGRDEELAALWEACGLVASYNPPLEDIAFARQSLDAEILVGIRDDRIVASTLVGHDGHRGWLYYVAVSPDQQGTGLGAKIVAAAEEWLREKGVRKVQLLVRPTNTKVLSFYEHLGYETSPVTVMQRWLIDDPR
ncbi:MAG TPA: GNAT family acetyltransferase [Thermomicrobiales bacterium]|nr:GNAT family acetyltransferase [Thermomicrobiales bacterium]